MGNENVILKPEDISPYVKELGPKIISYILDIDEEEVVSLLQNGGEIIKIKYEVLNDLHQFSDLIISWRSESQILEQRDIIQFAKAIDREFGTHKFNILRMIASGSQYQFNLTHDPVLNALSKICIESFPAFLLYQGRDESITLPPSFLIPSFHNTQINEAFEKAIANDPIISKILPDEDNSYKSIYSTSFRASGNIEKYSILPTILGNAYTIMRIENKLTIDALLSSAKHVLNIIRDAIDGRETQATVLLCFYGISISEKIETLNGALIPFHCGMEELFPRYSQPDQYDKICNSFVYETKVPYKIKFIKYDGFGYPMVQAVEPYDNKIFEDISFDISLACAMCAEKVEGDDPVSVHYTSEILLDPFTPGNSPRWKSTNSTISIYTPKELNKKETKNLSQWIENISIARDDSILIAKRRLHSALLERGRPEDSFIDCVIGLESLFGARSEVGLSVSMCVSKILHDNIEYREGEFKEVKGLYEKRSAILHGTARSIRYEDMKRYRDKSLFLLRNCLKKLYEDRNDLLDLDAHERVRKIALQ